MFREFRMQKVSGGTKGVDKSGASKDDYPTPMI